MKTFTQNLITGIMLLSAATPSFSQVLFKDLNTGIETTSSGTINAGSYPENFTNSGSTMYFFGKDKVTSSSTNGYLLYKTDGTIAGTSLLKVIGTNTGLNNLAFGITDYNGINVFANTSNGSLKELYRTDGTSAGTYVIKTFTPSNGANIPRGFCVSGTTLFFAADGGNGIELWKSDGTTAGTSEVIDLWTGTIPNFGGISGIKTFNSEPCMATFNNKVYFWANNGTTGGVYMSDGTSSGTLLLKALSAPGTPFFKVFNNQLFFNDGGGNLWKSDGTVAGSATVTGITSAASAILFNNSFFVAGTKLYKTDGTVAGTQQLLNNAGNICGANSTAFYMIDNSVIPQKYYVSDGTAAGTGTINWRIGASASFDLIGNKMYVTRSDSGVTQSYNNSFLWETDGTWANTTKLTSFNHGVHTFGNAIYFQNSDATSGNEPWVYNVSGATITSLPNTSKQQAVASVFPNPANGELHISLPDGDAGFNTDLIILNTLGQEMMRISIQSTQSSFNISELPSGIYIYRLRKNNAVIQSGKLQVNSF